MSTTIYAGSPCLCPEPRRQDTETRARGAQTKRPCIEVDTGDNGMTDDPISLFAHMLRVKYDSTKEVEEYNRKLLGILMHKGQIPKSSIVWRDEKLAKIYGFKIDSSGKIEYDSSSKSSPKKVKKVYAANIPDVDISMLKNAIIKSKQMAI